MNSLTFLWEFSLGLCVLAALALGILVFARVVTVRSGARQEAIRAQLLPALLAGEGDVRKLGGIELEIAADLTCELAELTRGSDREDLLQRAADMGVPRLLQQRIRSRSAQTRLTAVEALALFEDHVGDTAYALDDVNPDVRLAAALALAHRSDGPSTRLLVDKLKMGSEEHSLLLVSLMSDLAERNPGEVAALLFERDVPVEAKIAATDALAEGGGEYAPLLAYMAKESEGEPDLQPRIFRALGRNGHPAGMEAIFTGLGSDEWAVRASAAEAAGRLGASGTTARLGELLADENWWVRYRAGEALLRLGPRGINALRKASTDENEFVRGTASAMLAEGRVA